MLQKFLDSLWVMPIVIVGFSVVIIGMLYFNISNNEIRIRQRLEAQIDVREAYFDKVWKIINEKAQVADEYKKAFKEIYPALMEGRYGNDGDNMMMKWITESNPNFDVSLYKDLMASIEAERTGFFNTQKVLVDIDREHKTYRMVFPNSLFIGGRGDVKFLLVSSAKTKSIMSSGEENDVKLFK